MEINNTEDNKSLDKKTLSNKIDTSLDSEVKTYSGISDFSKSSTHISEEEKSMYSHIQAKLDISNNRYPFCIVWTPLPLISWFIPFIGHTGICR